MTRSTGPLAARRTRTRTASIAVALALVTGLAGCSSGDDAKTSSSSSTTTAASSSAPASTTAAPTAAHACNQGATTTSITDVPVDGMASDHTLTSFDGTEIRAHWFPAPSATKAVPAPTVLMGPGWSLAGDTSTNGLGLFGALGIGPMNKAGYNVLTWDPRGFGKSTGRATVNDPRHEGRDAQMLLDWVASQPVALKDRTGDPRVGMVGWSYGGGIQLTLASIDCRVDALVPGIAWHSLMTSLGKNDTLKSGWAGALLRLVKPDHVDPHVIGAYRSGLETARVSPDDRAWYTARGPGDSIDKITVPTLFVQGTVDTLFTLDEAVTNYESLHRRKVPVKMLWFCGGHGTCLTGAGSATRVSDATFAWLDRYLKGDRSVDTGPAIDLIDQNGTSWTGDAYPPKATGPLVAKGTGTLPLVAEGGAGPLTTPPPAGDILGAIVKGFTPSPAANAISVTASNGDIPTLVVGAPKLTITYHGTSPAGPKPNRVFAQLVDDERKVVIGNQITPIQVTLDGKPHTATVDLEVVAQYLKPGQTVTLQLVATTVAYAVPRLGGEITFEAITITLPTSAALKQG